MIGTATAPASSANLGPGFDFIALALEVRCEVSVVPANTWSCPAEARSIVEAVTSHLNVPGPYDATVTSAIPVGRGLGSSAALAVAAGAAALRARERPLELGPLFRAAAASDGHPDNAAAAVHGGLVAVAGMTIRHLPLSADLLPVIAVPNTTLSTAEARDALPASLPHPAAARSAARAAFLVEGLRTGDPEALAAASGDELHEGPRAGLSPLSAALVDAARQAGALHASWSGAGPSVVAFATSTTRDAVAEAMTEALGGAGAVTTPEVATTGVG